MNFDLVRVFARTLAETEWLSPDDLRAYQAPLLHRILVHAQTTTPFYRDKIEVDPDAPDRVWENWARVPIVTRAEVAANRDAFLSRSPPPETGAVTEGLTSGSIGEPLVVARSDMVATAAVALSERVMRWWNVDGRKAMARIWEDSQGIAAPPDGLVGAGWNSLHPDVANYVLSIDTDVAQQLRWLAMRRPAYLATHSGVLKDLARAVLASGSDLRFDLLFCFGSLVDGETRALCRSAFGAEILDTYSAKETGHLAGQCPACGAYHVSAEAAHLEVLRADGSAAAPGEVGKVVVTPFYNYAMPFIRYEIGDLAVAAPSPSSCGRGLPNLSRILGRYRNVFRFRDGSVLAPDVEKLRLKDFIGPARSQVVQVEKDHIEVRYVAGEAAPSVDLPALTQRVQAVLGQNVRVSIRPVEAIARLPSGKFEDCVSLVPPD